MNIEKAKAELELFGNIAEERQEGDLTADDVRTMRRCSRSHAYLIMDEAVREGKYTPVIIYPKPGRSRPVKAIRPVK